MSTNSACAQRAEEERRILCLQRECGRAIQRIAAQYEIPGRHDVDDLEQEAYLALLAVVRKYPSIEKWQTLRIVQNRCKDIWRTERRLRRDYRRDDRGADAVRALDTGQAVWKIRALPPDRILEAEELRARIERCVPPHARKLLAFLVDPSEVRVAVLSCVVNPSCRVERSLRKHLRAAAKVLGTSISSVRASYAHLQRAATRISDAPHA